jgi:hypothetical protein
MSALSIQPTYPIFTETDGQPLENGYIWIGQVNLDPQVNPINVYFDVALTILAPQPIRTINGYPSRNGTPARLYVNSDYSIRVQDKNGSTVYSAPAATERYSEVVTPVDGFVNVKEFGAVGDGITNDTAAIRAAMAAANIVYFPTGNYLIQGTNTDATDGLQLKANQTVFGDGFSSAIVQGSSSNYIMSANQGTGGTPDPADNMKSIVVRDLAFVNNAGTFSEFKHMLNLNAVSDVVVERCLFKGFQGDGIYLGSSNVAATERHNENVVIRDCVFDGVNNQNRNGISVIDGNGILIDKNTFTNVSKLGMPGCIDLEPDSFSFPIIRNITIQNNRMFDSLGAGVGLLLGYANISGASPPINIRISNNYMLNCTRGFGGGAYDTASNLTPNCNWLIDHNTVEACTNSMFLFSGCSGLIVENNQFINNPFKGEIGFDTPNYNVSFVGNTFQNNGRSTTACLWIRTNTLLTFERNVFIDNGASIGAGQDMNFLAGWSGSQINLRNNVFSSPLGYTTTSIRVDPTYTLDNGSCDDVGNTWDYVATIQFNGNGSDRFTSVPTTGTWSVGNKVYNKTPTSNGLIGWVCTTAGSPGTWSVISTRLPFPRFIERNYTTPENFDAATYDYFSLLIQSNPALTYNAPTGGTVGQIIYIRVKNISGVPMGTITWDSVFKFTSWTNPASGNSRTITFAYDGTNWNQVSYTPADVPN